MLYPKNSNTNDISEYMTANRHINFIGCNSDDNMRDSLLYMKLLLYFCITLIIDILLHSIVPVIHRLLRLDAVHGSEAGLKKNNDITLMLCPYNPSNPLANYSPIRHVPAPSFGCPVVQTFNFPPVNKKTAHSFQNWLHKMYFTFRRENAIF